MLKPLTVFADVFSHGQLFATPWTIAHQVPLSMEFSRHEYWSGLPFPSPLTVWITANWKMLKELGVPDHLNCLLRNLYVGQEATVRTRQGTTDWLKIGKGVQTRQCIVTCLFNLYAEYLMQNAGLDGREKYQ